MGLHHFSTLFSPSWSEFLRESKDGLDVYREASSAKSSFLTLFSVELTCRGKSFIYNRNKRGPRIDPWGTPVATICFLERERERGKRERERQTHRQTNIQTDKHTD